MDGRYNKGRERVEMNEHKYAALNKARILH